MLLTSNVCISDTVFAEEVLSNTAPVATYEVVETPAAVSNTAAEPAAQITPEPAVKAAAEPAVETAAEPKAEDVAKPTAEPAAEATAKPAAEATAEPAAEVTPEPTVEATAEPAATATVEPTAEATAEPTVDPTAEVTPEPTEAVAPHLSALHASSKVALGSAIVWTFECEHAEKVTYRIYNDSDACVAEGEAAEHRIEYTPSAAGRYTIVLSASNEAQSVEARNTVIVINGELTLNMWTKQSYAIANEWSMYYGFNVAGGLAPYDVHFTVSLNGVVNEQDMHLGEAGESVFEYTPAKYGDYTVEIRVTDATGETKSSRSTMPVADRKQETSAQWAKSVRGAKLTGDWRKDIIAIAETQIGYRESQSNFEINDEGKRYGYTRYGAWYGASYSDWCAMFISFCLEYAKIPAKYVPRDAGCEHWRTTMKALEVYQKRSEADPQPGDIVFFNWTGKHSDGAQHVGIVESVDENRIYTIEGNTGNRVARRDYSRNDGDIMGYASMKELMRRAGVLEQFEQIEAEVDLDAECTCGAVADENGVVIHKEGCPLYIDPADAAIEPADNAQESYSVYVTIEPETAQIGDEVTFAAHVSGGDPNAVRWQWQSSVDGSDWQDIEGAEGLNYTTRATLETFLSSFRVKMIDDKPTEEVGLLASLDSLVFGTALAEEIVASAPVQLPMRAANGNDLYWNPNPSATYSKDGEIIVAPGKEENDGSTLDKPVLTLRQVEEYGAGKTVHVMNFYELAEDETFNPSGKVILTGYAGTPDGNGGIVSGTAHDGAYMYLFRGVTVELNNMTISVDRKIELEGGKLILGSGMAIGSLFLVEPSENVYPLEVKAANGSNGGKYIVDFVAGYDMKKVGLTVGNTADKVGVTAALDAMGWHVTYDADDDHTYAVLDITPPAQEAIYLNGQNGSDAYDGSSPLAAVKTFERAIEILQAKYASGVRNIYILGTVNTEDGKTYELPAETPDAKVIRFAGNDNFSAFTGALFACNSGSAEINLPIDNGEVSGSSAAISVAGGKLALGGTISGTIGYGVNVSKGELNLNNANINTSKYYGVYANGGSIAANGGRITGIYAGSAVASVALNGTALIVSSDADRTELGLVSASADTRTENCTGTVRLMAGAKAASVNDNLTSYTVGSGATAAIDGSRSRFTNVVNSGVLTVGENTAPTVTGLAANSGATTNILSGTVTTIENAGTLTLDKTAAGAAPSVTTLNTTSIVTVNAGTVQNLTAEEDAKGNIVLNGGTVQNITLEQPITAAAHIVTNGSCAITNITINGKINADYPIELTDALRQSSKITISVSEVNRRDKQKIVNVQASAAQLSKFQLQTALADDFTLGSPSNSKDILMYLRGVFINASSGSDSNSGLNSDSCVKTFAKAGTVLKAQVKSNSKFPKRIVVVNGTLSSRYSLSDTLDMTGTDGVIVMPYSPNVSSMITVPSSSSSLRYSLTMTNVTLTGGTIKDEYPKALLTVNSNSSTAISRVTLNNVKTEKTVNAICANGGSVTLNDCPSLTADNNVITVNVYSTSSSAPKGTVTMNGTTHVTGGKYGAVVTKGTLTMNGSAQVSNAELTGVYVDVNGIFTMNGGSVQNNGSTDSGANGGGVFVAGTFTANSNPVTISGNAAANGGGIYYANEATLSLGENINITNNTAVNGGGVYVAAGTVEQRGAAITGNTANRGSAAFVGKDGTLAVVTGAVEGNVTAAGSVQLYATNALESAPVTEDINLLNFQKPVVLVANDAAAVSFGKQKVIASSSFLGQIIVQGTDALPAVLVNFTVEGVTYSEITPNIVGGGSEDVYWDPQQLGGSGVITDDNDGSTPSKAVLTFERATKLLAQRTPASRIVMCSAYISGGEDGDTLNGSVTNATETWNATLVRGQAADVNGTQLLGDMFIATSYNLTLQNMVISGDYVDGTTIVPTGSLVNAKNTSNSYTVMLENVELKNNNRGTATGSGEGAGLYAEGYNVTLRNVHIHDCSASYGGGVYFEDPKSGSNQIKMTDVVIEDNLATYGGGFAAYKSNSGSSGVVAKELENVVIRNNTATQGGGMWIGKGGSTFSANNTLGTLMVVDNKADYGGGLYLSRGSWSAGFSNYFNANTTVEGNTAKDGAGFYVNNLSVSIYGTVQSNKATGNGGGVYIRNTGRVTIYSKIENNSAQNGGGVYSLEGNLTLSKGSKITNNVANSYGGGIYFAEYGYENVSVYASSTQSNRIEISGNSANNGGGMYLDSSSLNRSYSMSVSLQYVNVINNSSKSGGSGIAFRMGACPSEFTMTGCLVEGNRGGAAGLYCSGSDSRGGALTLTNTDIKNNDCVGLYLDVRQTNDRFETTSPRNISVSNCTISGNGTYGIQTWLTNSTRAVSNATVTGCTITGNSAGGWYSSKATSFPIAFTDTEIKDNGGYGVYLLSRTSSSSSSGGTTKNAMLVGGSITGHPAGGVYCGADNDLTMNGVTVANNGGANNGAGICVEGYLNGTTVYSANLTLSGGRIEGNSTSGMGGGLYVGQYAAATVSGTTFTGNTASLGGGIATAKNKTTTSTSDNLKLTVNSAVINGNTATSNALASGIYNEGHTMEMGGSSVNITDNIYLNDNAYRITLTGSMRTGRVYNIALNVLSFKGGDVVVQPRKGEKGEEVYPPNAAQYLRYNIPLQAGYVFAKGGAEEKCIVLKQCLFVDGVNGNDGNSGMTPEYPKKTMQEALAEAELGEYVIYVCGKVTCPDSETWQHENTPVIIKRYTGFSIGGVRSYPAYSGTMFEVPAGKTLTIGNHVDLITGLNTEQDVYRPSGSIFDVKGTLILNNNDLIIESNPLSAGNGGAINNTGKLIVQQAAQIRNVSAGKGGAIYNAGTMETSAALTIDNASATNDGGAIYNTGSLSASAALTLNNVSAGGDGSAVYQAGSFSLNAGASLTTGGVVYLTNDGYLAVANSAVQMTNPLSIDIGDPYDGRVYVQYGADGAADAETERARYSLPARITSTYTLMDKTEADQLTLYLGQKNVVYVDPTFTGDAISGRVQGDYADYPFTTLADAYKKLSQVGGGLIYVVTPIHVQKDTTVAVAGYTDEGTLVNLSEGMVSIKRYSRPSQNLELFTHETNEDELFIVEDGAKLTLQGIVLDGHAQAVTAASENYPHTIAPAVKTESPLVSIENGALELTGGAELGGCTRAINNGATLSVAGQTKIGGSVYLAPDKVVNVTGAETKANAVHILLDDAKNGRIIATYTEAPAAAETGKYLLDSAITSLYKLKIDGNNVILVAKGAAYVDGKAGDDARDGTTPAKAVKTLKQAYANLQADGGGTIYIVDTVSIDQNVTLAKDSYFDDENEIPINGGSVTIRRYSKPDATITGFTKASCTGAMLQIQAGGALTLQDIVIDGHSQRFDAGKAETTANGVNAAAAMIDVSGTLTMEAGAALKNNNNTSAAVGGGAIRIRSTGTVRIHGGEITGNAAEMGGDGVYNFGRLEISGEPKLDAAAGAEQWIFMDENHVIYVTDTLAIDDPLPVDLTERSYQNGHVIAVYSDGLTPDHTKYNLRDQFGKMETRCLSLGTEDQNVLLMAAYRVDYTGLKNISKTPDSPDRVPHGTEIRATLTPDAGYILPPDITVVRTEEDGSETTLTPKASADDPNGDYFYDQKTGTVIVDGDAVTGKISLRGEAIQSFIAEVECTLYAIETNRATAAYPQTATIELTKLIDQNTNTNVPLLMLAGKTFKVAGITAPDGIQITDKAAIESVKTTAGYDYANANFAIGAKAGSAAEAALKDAAQIAFANDLSDAAATLALTVYNANAITVSDTLASAPVVQIVLKDADMPDDTASSLTLNIRIVRVASQINVTVPLVVVARTNIDGGSFDVKNSSYAISNESDMRVQLTEKTVTHNADTANNPLTKTDDADLTGKVDTYRIEFDDAVRDIAAKGETGDSVNPLNKFEFSRLSFVTKETAADGTEYGVKAATIQYKLEIPKDNLAVEP